ncbi:MAG TPA: cytochrome c [Gemmatimonadaceae bacterium]|jgi:cytochrome c|nr:cytochrome c [Gemmatimonadaceae bacterium]
MSRAVVLLTLGASLVLACSRSGSGPADSSSARRGSVSPAPSEPASYALGRPPEPQEIAAWDLDVNPDGVGLPSGRATAIEGAVVYAAKCATCHGAKGEGVAPNPPIVGREPREGFAFGRDPALVKTVGNYWPYATTVYDYVRRAMPQDKPGSLLPNELYGVTAWILAENGIIARDVVIDSLSLPKIKMPARDRFVRDDRLTTPNFK